MKEMYDNGEQFIGMCKDLRDYNNKLYENNTIDEDTYNEWEEELKDIQDNCIVMIDYSFGMGNIIRTWDEHDIVEKEKED